MAEAESFGDLADRGISGLRTKRSSRGIEAFVSEPLHWPHAAMLLEYRERVGPDVETQRLASRDALGVGIAMHARQVQGLVQGNYSDVKPETLRSPAFSAAGRR